MSAKSNENLRGVVLRFSKNRFAVLGLILIILFCLVAVFASHIAPYSYEEQDLLNTLMPPSSEHWFGTDEFGRDIFSRIIYASRVSLKVGIIAVGIGMIVGGILGAVSGYYGGWLDNLIMRAMDIILSIPSILLAIAIAASLGPGVVNIMIAIGISSVPQYARIVRGSVLSIRSQQFVIAARAVGGRDFHIIFKHILPNCMAPIIVQATLGVAWAILNTAGLSFIGLGIQPPIPEWGAMLSSGRNYIRDFSYMTLFPGLAIMITILALNFVGDGLRDALDPKMKR